MRETRRDGDRAMRSPLGLDPPRRARGRSVLGVCFALLAIGLPGFPGNSPVRSGMAWAVGPESSYLDLDPDYRDARLAIDAKDYPTAIERLERVLKSHPLSPDVLNWLGFSHRKLKHYPTSKRYYDAALAIDPAYLPALEYQGEWYLETGDMARARANLAILERLCGRCHEWQDLAQAIDAAEASTPSVPPSTLPR